MTCCFPFLLASVCCHASFSFPPFCPYVFTLPITSVQLHFSQRSASQLILNKNPLAAGSHDMLSPFFCLLLLSTGCAFWFPVPLFPIFLHLESLQCSCISPSLIGKYERVYCIAIGMGVYLSNTIMSISPKYFCQVICLSFFSVNTSLSTRIFLKIDNYR